MAELTEPARHSEGARLRATVHGRVQGVNFRAFTADQALRLGLTGTVRNQPDGRTVLVEAEGARESLNRLIAALHQGPRFSRVERVEVEWLPPTGIWQDFRVIP
jgi:acylphosphatase